MCKQRSAGCCAPQDEADKLLVVERGDLVFVFNFHPTNSYTDYGVGTYLPGPYKVPDAATSVLHDLLPPVTLRQQVNWPALPLCTDRAVLGRGSVRRLGERVEEV